MLVNELKYNKEKKMKENDVYVIVFQYNKVVVI